MIVKTFNLPNYDLKEILRYMGSNLKDENSISLINQCVLELKDLINPKIVYEIFPINNKGDFIDLSFTSTKSESIKKLLVDSNKIVLFASTIGLGIDRLIYKYSNVSPLKALCFQAIGTERVESLCDEFCKFINDKFKNTTIRFSPGYQNISLDMQKDIFKALTPEKYIGLTLNDSLIMSPTKSVTAIIGIKKDNSNCDKICLNKCVNCNNYDCLYRSK